MKFRKLSSSRYQVRRVKERQRLGKRGWDYDPNLLGTVVREDYTSYPQGFDSQPIKVSFWKAYSPGYVPVKEKFRTRQDAAMALGRNKV